MARIEDLPATTRDAVAALACVQVQGSPWIDGPPLARRRVALLTSAALHRRGDAAFAPGSAEWRELPDTLDAGDLLMSHVSINFDRSGFQRDLNTVYPVDRLRELAAEGLIGSVAAAHFSCMGSTDPVALTATVAPLVERLQHDGVDAVVLCPV